MGYLVIVVIGNGRRVSVLRPVRDRVSISSAGVAEKRRREGRLVWAPPGRAIDLDREATAPSRGGRAERFHETTKRQKQNKTKQNQKGKEDESEKRETAGAGDGFISADRSSSASIRCRPLEATRTSADDVWTPRYRCVGDTVAMPSTWWLANRHLGG